ALTLTVPDEAERTAVLVARLDRAALIRDQRHERRVSDHLGDAADETVARHDGSLLPDAVVSTGRDHNLIVELAAPADDARVDGRVVAREERAIDEVQLVTQARVLRTRRLAELRLLPKLVDLRLQPSVLALHVHESREVAVHVAERTGDTLGRDLERPQHGGAGRLHAAQRPGRRLAKRDRDQDQREHDEAHHDAPAPKCGPVAGGEGLGSRSRYGRAQDRADTAVARHGATSVSWA